MTGPHDNQFPQDAQAREFHREQLSAMVDGELSADESRFLLRRMEHDDALADRWQRWQFYGDAMRGNAGRALPADFAQRVGRAIADDIAAAETASTQATQGGRSFRHWGGGAALAASVALAALLGPRLMNEHVAVDDAPLVAASATAPASPALPQPAPSSAPSLPTTEAATAATLAAVAAAERRSQRPRIMAASRAEMDVSSARVARAPARPASRRAAETVITTNAADAPVLTYAAVPHPPSTDAPASKPWPRALVPAASQTDEVVVVHPAGNVRRSPFQADFVPLIEASQAEQAAARSH